MNVDRGLRTLFRIQIDTASDHKISQIVMKRRKSLPVGKNLTQNDEAQIDLFSFDFPPEILDVIHSQIIYAPNYLTFMNWHSTCSRYWNWILDNDYDYVIGFLTKCREKNTELFKVNFNSIFHKNIQILNEANLIFTIIAKTKAKMINKFLARKEDHVSKSMNVSFPVYKNIASFFGPSGTNMISKDKDSFTQAGFQIVKEVSRHLAFRYGWEVCFLHQALAEKSVFPYCRLLPSLPTWDGFRSLVVHLQYASPSCVENHLRIL
jgi:hypothetical protein